MKEATFTDERVIKFAKDLILSECEKLNEQQRSFLQRIFNHTDKNKPLKDVVNDLQGGEIQSVLSLIQRSKLNHPVTL